MNVVCPASLLPRFDLAQSAQGLNKLNRGRFYTWLEIDGDPFPLINQCDGSGKPMKNVVPAQAGTQVLHAS
jgi:hypothetical protein